MLRQEINFYQPQFRERSVRYPASLLLQAAAAVIVTMALLAVYANVRVSGVRTELTVIAQQEEAAIERLQNLRTTIDEVVGETSWAERLASATSELAEKEASLRLISGTELGDADGFARHLRSLAEQSLPGLWLTNIALSARGDRVWLQGIAQRAALVPTYLQNLADEVPFASQRFHRLEIDEAEDNGRQVVSFVVTSDDSLEGTEALYQ